MAETTNTLDKKYRPTSLEYVHGNHETIKAINKMMEREGDIPSTILLHGPSGCGKTTLARIVAGMLGAKGRDLKEYNISNMRGIDMARDIIKLLGVVPWGDRRVIILNECHKATNEFQNAMLESLEEPPPRNHFILCTTEPDRLIKTIRTRSTKLPVRLLKSNELEPLVRGVAEAEGAALDDRVVYRIVALADGSPREALVILDSIIDLETTDEMLEGLATYSARVDDVIDLCRALMEKSKPWKNIVPIIQGLNDEPESIRRAILGYLEKIIMSDGQQTERAAMMMDLFAAPWFNVGRPALTQACYLALKIN